MAERPLRPQEINAEARKTLNAVQEALSEWRDEMEAAGERYSGKVTERLGEAAKAFGWPEGSVELATRQMKEVSKAQLEFIDKVMDTWQQVIKAPGTFPSPDAFSAPGLWPSSSIPGGVMTPVQFWAQAADMWQKNWASAMDMWTGGRHRH